ncbi:hypothetical protein WDW89_19990 [Deltaproteobacteria bacterium TL4]
MTFCSIPTKHWASLGLLLFFLGLCLLLTATPAHGEEAFPGEDTEPSLGLEEDPFASDTDKAKTSSEESLGLEEDPFSAPPSAAKTSSKPAPGDENNLSLEEDPFASENENPPVAGKGSPTENKDPPAKNKNPLVNGAKEDPFGEDSFEDPFANKKEVDVSTSTNEETDDGEGKEDEDENFEPQLSFTHQYRVLGGYTATSGLISFENRDLTITELRFITSYQQTIRIRTSPKLYNFVRISIAFAQNFDTNNQRYIDNTFVLREIYLNYELDKHQFRVGSQIFKIGKVDFDRTIDALNKGNFSALNTLDPDSTKESLTALKYDWVRRKKVLTLYAAPLQQRSLGMEFTEFREDSNARDAGQERESRSFVRDYFGLQHEWKGNFATRIGFFHWFDQVNTMEWEYKRADLVDTNFLDEKSTIDNFISTFKETESFVNFFTLELDAEIGGLVWKLDSGLFDHKNFSHYERLSDDNLRYRTVRLPHFAVATSLEKTFSRFFLMATYSDRFLFQVPPDTHILFYENEATPLQVERDLRKTQVSGLVAFEFNDSVNTTLATLQTYPYQLRAIVNTWMWNRYEFSSKWQLRMFHAETDVQKMLGEAVISDQIFLIYTRTFLKL